MVWIFSKDHGWVDPPRCWQPTAYPPSFIASFRSLEAVLIVNRGSNAWSMLTQNFGLVLAALALVVLVEIANDYVDLERPVFSFAAVGLLVTALSISLVFRVNEAYARWWEARTLWGTIVNDSRSWCRQVHMYVTGEESGAVRRRLVHRHIAYVNALRLSRRTEESLNDLEPFLEAEEFQQLANYPNPAAALLQGQGDELATLRVRGAIDAAAQHRLDMTLSQLCEAQGGCERIKKTVFPDRVAYFTRWSAWLMAAIIPILVLDRENTFDVIDFVFVPLMMLSFLLTEKLGAELKRPFENLPNDTPMTSLCRTIEIDLRAMLGETQLPMPIEPVKGVLM
jgi:putative membrane protein